MEQLRGLYAITDSNLMPSSHFAEMAEAALAGGAKLLQYRDKSNNPALRTEQTSLLRLLCNQYHAKLIINDDIELAMACHADGVHLGLQDKSIQHARLSLGKNKIIGASCYAEIKLAQAAKNAGADYLAFGSLYPSNTKPSAAHARLDLLSQAKQQLKLPICGIGGIKLENATEVISAGADLIAVVSDLFARADIRHTAKLYSQLFDQGL